MDGENNGTRSFPRNYPDKPKKSFDLRKTVAIAIFAVAITIVLLFCAAIIAQIVSKVNDGSTGIDPTVSKTDIKFESRVIAKSEINKGILQIATKERPASLSQEEINNLASLYESSARKNGSVVYYTTINATLQLTLETSDNLGALAKALYEESGSNDIDVIYAYFEPKSGYDSCEFSHALGTTVDIRLSISGGSYPLSARPEILTWINENCAKFGFINSDISGDVHGVTESVQTTQLRYVGIPHATYIMQNGITFEEYVERIKSYYPYNNPLIITGADKKTYAIYYAPVDGVNSLKLPTNFDYTISGNNENGIIVTVDLSSKK